MTSEVKQERIDWIDELKGFLLLCVCLFHTNNAWYGLVGFMFNMPAFFFISGFLFKESKYIRWKDFLYSKYRSLLLPYISLSLLFLFFTPMMYVPNEYGGTWHFLKSSVIEIVQGYSGPYTVPLWFVYVLFVVNQIYYFVWNLLKERLLFLGMVALISVLGAWFISKSNLKIPFHLDTSLVGLFFFSGGHLFRKFFYPHFISLSRGWQIFTGVSMFLLYLIGYFIDGEIDIRTCSLGDNLGAFVIGTVGGVIFIFVLFYLMNQILQKSVLGGFLGDVAINSIVILAVHYWVLMTLLWFFDFVRPPYFLAMALLAEIVIVLFFIKIFQMKYLCTLTGTSRR